MSEQAVETDLVGKTVFWHRDGTLEWLKVVVRVVAFDGVDLAIYVQHQDELKRIARSEIAFDRPRF